jgi:hypothetical protein
MRRQREAQEWEYIVERDLVPHLLPAGPPGSARHPADLAELPDGAHAAMLEGIGRVGLEDLLLIPPVAWSLGRWRWLWRSRYSPRCVAGIGERGVALWVQALPVPGVRVHVPFSEIAAVEQHHDGPRRTLVVTGRAASLSFRYEGSGQVAVNAWTQRLRSRAAAGGR